MIKAPYALRYSWSVWVTNGNLNELSKEDSFERTACRKPDGLRLLERQIQRRDIFLVFSTTPEVPADHLHLGLRGNIEQSAAEIALAFQNHLTHMLERGPIGMNGYYAGTFGDYDRNAIRARIEHFASSHYVVKRVVADQSSSPAG